MLPCSRGRSYGRTSQNFGTTISFYNSKDKFLCLKVFLNLYLLFSKIIPLPKFWLFYLFCSLEMGHLQYSIAKCYGNCTPINHNFPVNLFKENVFRLDNKTFIMLPYEALVC